MTFPIRTTGDVTPIRPDPYLPIMQKALDAGDDWPRKLRCAQVLATAEGPENARYRSLAWHIHDAYELHLAGLLKPAPQPKTLPPLAPPARPKTTLRLDDLAVICGGAFVVVMIVTALFAPWIWR